MIWFFRIIVWLIFLGIGAYLIYYWNDEDKAEKKLDAIRKLWYVIYIFGALIYWTGKPQSIFTNWDNYLVVLVVFILIDAFIFLSLYLKKIGNNELARITRSVENNQMLLDDLRAKVNNALYILKTEGITAYYGNKEHYLYGLKLVLQSYVEKEGHSFTILPFETPQEKNEALAAYTNASLIQSTLSRAEAYYNQEDNFAFYPFNIEDEIYVIKISSTAKVSDVDGSLIGILLATYDILVQALERSDDE
ncbi:type II toxin-antitoxin system SpoIISA family toxin [Fictibacillus terranigra]|uniref:Type II toxin-antitoxin system SpoIISA family toxin n=1 Tax=Fictibacillus terranigra TaxID=3058424 RepID=A0ABT8E839_9BACL|nr:type II toxin-antitoxin system SpoIISA family toxin [Fictibacillus sp. CENA-BCM004]MDN4074091.1 type II toxin-antitoxin system SpoIISA family toxin [Fictibacillus sp. CENA-BCM004]